MSRSRNMLHISKLDEFTAWLRERGWLQGDTRGEYEVLRMTKPGCDTLLVHRKGAVIEHLTTWGESHTELLTWFRERKEEANVNGPTTHR